MDTVNISIVLDKRRKKDDKTFPVKLRVYDCNTQRAKRYATRFSLTEDDFNSVWLTTKPRTQYRDLRNQLDAERIKAVKEARTIEPFDFHLFEKKLYRQSGEGENIVYHYEQIIAELQKDNQFGTASGYDLSLKSIQRFIKYNGKTNTERILFRDITSKWLNEFERFLVKEENKSLTTVSIYSRCLRAVFNRAIKSRDIDKAQYPFGTEGYQVPAVKRVKKALSNADLKKIFDAKTASVEETRARDFFFFSYSCNGVNVKDIALIKPENIKGDTVKFFRAKTIRTSKENLFEVVIYLTDFAKGVIDKYKTAGEYLFPILRSDMSEIQKHKAVKNFTRFINQHLKKIALREGVTGDISSYFARHSFSTNAIRSGASMEMVSEALGHADIATTKGYFAGFEDSAKKELMEKLMKF